MPFTPSKKVPGLRDAAIAVNTPSAAITVHGISLDEQTRCAHYDSPLDIIAIRMHCCNLYFACRECHDVSSDHPAEVIPHADFNQPAVLCGNCGNLLTVHQYLRCKNTCPACPAHFNPNCRNHYHLYFESHNPPTK